jgi:hypothetical protein
VELTGAAEAIRKSLGAGAPTRLVMPVDARAASKGHLDEDTIRQAWDQGLALTVDEAVALALQESVGSTRPADDPEMVREGRDLSSTPEG